jgi:hypothetical protein
MKLNTKTRTYFVRFLLLGIIIGTLSWAIIEKLLALLGLPFDLSLGPIGLDFYLISLFFRVNPGTLLGALLGYRLFAKA